MSYEAYTKKIRKMKRDFTNEIPNKIVHCPTGVTLDRCHEFDSWCTNGEDQDPHSATKRRETKWHETKAKFNRGDMENIPLTFPEGLRHDMLRSDLVANIQQMISDKDHESKRLTYFSSNKLRYELFIIFVLAAVDNECVSASYISRTFTESNSSIRRELKICLEAGWIVEHKIDASLGYMATAETVNTYYLRMRRLYSGPGAVSANSLLRITNFASLCRYEDDFNETFPRYSNKTDNDSDKDD
jgi:hypothetical protein